MSEPTTRDGEISTAEANKLARAFGAQINQSGNGTKQLNGIILGVAAFGMLTLIGIGAYGLTSLVDLKSEVAEMKGKVDILFQERRRP